MTIATTVHEGLDQSQPTRRGRLGAAKTLVLVVVAGFLVLGAFEAWHDSSTYDEPVYVSAGVAAILHHDLADNAEHPPLFKVLAALPVLVVQPVVPANGHWNTNDERSYSARFIRAQLHAGTLHRVTFASRLVPLLEGALVALALFALAGTLFGSWAGVLAALLWLLDPIVLGIGHLDGVDLPFALTAVLVSLALVRWLRRRDLRATVWLGVAGGLAATAQATGLLLVALVAVAVVMATVRSGRRGIRSLLPAAQVLVVVWLLIWLSYIVINPSVVAHPGVGLPHPYIDGIRYLGSHDTGGSPGFLLGQAWSGINVWFWPASLLVKVPVALLVLLVAGKLALVALVRSGRVDKATWHLTLVAVALPAVVLFAFEVVNPKTLGVRYLLPFLALWAVVASPLAIAVGRRGAITIGAVVTLAGATLVSSFPDSIAYSSPPFRPAYRVATDSNVDWGQDFGALVTWSRTHHPYVAYFGPRGLGIGQIPGARALVGTSPSAISGWVAASASDLTSADRTSLAWLRSYCPIRTLGGTILLYDFSSSPSGTPGPATPGPLCRSGTRFSYRTSGGISG